MPKYQLTGEQDQFLQTFIVGKGMIQRRRATSAYTDYCRRESKVVAEIVKLNLDSNARAIVQADLDEAQAMKDLGNFKQAYKSLKAIKQTARIASQRAEGAAAAIDPGQIYLAIHELEIGLDAVWHEAQTLQGDIDALEAAPNLLDSKRDGIGEMLRKASELRLLMPQLPQRAQAISDDARRIGAPQIIGKLQRQIDTLDRAGTPQQKPLVPGLVAELQDVQNRNRIGIHNLWDADLAGAAQNACDAMQAWWNSIDTTVEQSHAQGVEVLEEIPDARDDLRKIGFDELDAREEQRVDWAKTEARRGAVLEAIPLARDGLRKVGFDDLKAREEERVGWAKQRLEAAYKRDAILSGPDPLDPLAGQDRPRPTQLREFDIEDLNLDLNEAMSDREAAAAAQAAAEELGALMQREAEGNPNSDVLFDLLLKNNADFTRMIGDYMGWVGDRAQWTEAQSKLAATVAGALLQQVQDGSPNKMSKDGSVVTVGGKTFTKDALIGKGGFGDITRFVGQDGAKIVVKSLQKPEKRNDMVTEVRMHRRAMGGENGAPHPNIVPLRGVALGPDGGLMMLMDEAEGGDAYQLNSAMLAAQGSGALSKGARDALARNMFLQMAEGMKRVHDANMTHNDIKGANFLVTAGGTVQVADFGSGRETDEEGRMVTEESAVGRRAREEKLAEVKAAFEGLERELARAEESKQPQELTEHVDEKASTDPSDTESLRLKLLELQSQIDLLSTPSPEAYKLAGLTRYDPPATQIKGGKPPTTERFAFETVSTKSDIFLLGAMLDVLTRDVHESEAKFGGTGIRYSVVSRQTGHEATSLDRLRNRMLEKSPTSRPSLDAVLGSAYLQKADFMADAAAAVKTSFSDDAPPEDRDYRGMLNQLGRSGPDHAEEELARLQAAVTAYGRQTRAQIEPLQKDISDSVYKVERRRKTIEKTHLALLATEKDAAGKQGALDLARTTITSLQEAIEKATQESDQDFDVATAQEQLTKMQDGVPALENAATAAQQKHERDKASIENMVKALLAMEKSEADVQKGLRAQIAQVNGAPDVAPLLAAIAEASESFGKPQQEKQAA